MIQEMARIQLTGLKQNAEKVILLLHDFGNLQIDDIRDVPDITIQPFSMTEKIRVEKEELDLLIANINGLTDLFSKYRKYGKKTPGSHNASLHQVKDKVGALISQIQYLNNLKKTLEDELILLSKYSDMLQAIIQAMPVGSKKTGNAIIRTLVHSTQMRKMQLLAQQLKLLTRGKFEMISLNIEESTNAVIGIFPVELISQVEEFIEHEKVTQMILPEEYAYLNNEEALKHIQKKIDINHAEIQENEQRVERLAVQWLLQMNSWQMICRDRIDELNAYMRLGETEYTFLLFGWVPNEHLAVLKQKLHSIFGNTVVVQKIDVHEKIKDKIPVKLQNPEWLHPFANFVRLRAVPKYSDIDPSPLVAIFMPLFFGLMVADFGYGLIIFLLAVFLTRKKSTGLVGDLLKALKIGSLWTIFFGIIFGEYFGSLGESIGLEPIWINRTAASSVIPLMGMAIAVGCGHIMLGLIIGAWNAIRHKNIEHFLERVGMLTGLIGVLLVAGSLMEVIPEQTALFGWIVFATGIVALAISHGPKGIFLGPIEFVGLIGNILSYLRIAALGLASVFLAEVANELGGIVGSVLAGVLIAGLIHALNIVMGILSPTIQSLRLQYVEFFRRFFEGGNSAYKPFRRRISMDIVSQ